MKDVIVESLSGFMSTILIIIVSILVVTYYVDSSIDKSYIITLIISLYFYSAHVMLSIFGFVGIAIFPLDIGLSNFGESASSGLVLFWWIIYISTSLISWFYLPVMKDYWASGEFSSKYRLIQKIKNRARLHEAVASNVRQYLIIGVIFVIAALFIIFGHDMCYFLFIL